MGEINSERRDEKIAAGDKDAKRQKGENAAGRVRVEGRISSRIRRSGKNYIRAITGELLRTLSERAVGLSNI